MVRLLAIGLTGLILGAPLVAQESKPDLARELELLLKAHQKAYADWNAKTEERKKTKLDQDKEPTKEFVGKFKDLAARAKGTEAAVGAITWLVQNDSSDEHPEAVALLEEFKHSPNLDQLIEALRYETRSERLERALAKLAVDSPHGQVRTAALWALAGTDALNGNMTPEQKKALDRLVAEYPTTIKGQEAKHALAVYERYAVGRTPPDFEGTDVDGKRIKLSDFRGKIVLIDFWGFW